MYFQATPVSDFNWLDAHGRRNAGSQKCEPMSKLPLPDAAEVVNLERSNTATSAADS